MIDRLTPRSAILIVAGSVLVLALIGWFVFVSPQRAKAAELSQEITSMEVRLDLAERVTEGDEPEARTVQLRRLAVAMPEEVAMPQILRQLSDAAGSARVAIDGITPSPPVPAAGAQAVPISLTLDGHYFGLANFLQALRTLTDAKDEEIRASGRLYSIDSVGFGASTGTDVGRVTATITMNAFTFAGGAVTAPTAPTETSDTTGSAAGTDG